MGTSPISPTSLAQSAKSFWGRPEGKVGITFLAVVFGGVFLYTWSKILGWLISMLADTIHLAMLAGILVAIIFVLTNWRTHLAFRLLMRWITGLFITIDPIGVLKDHLVEMKKRRDVMNDQISNVRGAKQRLEDGGFQLMTDSIRILRPVQSRAVLRDQLVDGIGVTQVE